MKKIEGFRMRQLGREHIIVGENVKLVNFNKMIVLNQSAAYLWEKLGEDEFSTDDISGLLVGKYEVDPDTARQDAERLASEWLEAGIVEE